MIISTNWLADYISVPASVDELVDRLMMAGLNHESTRPVGDDTAIEIEVTSNRPDCLGHIGVAREAAVLFARPLHIPDPRPLESDGAASARVAVEIDAGDRRHAQRPGIVAAKRLCQVVSAKDRHSRRRLPLKACIGRPMYPVSRGGVKP